MSSEEDLPEALQASANARRFTRGKTQGNKRSSKPASSGRGGSRPRSGRKRTEQSSSEESSSSSSDEDESSEFVASPSSSSSDDNEGKDEDYQAPARSAAGRVAHAISQSKRSRGKSASARQTPQPPTAPKPRNQTAADVHNAKEGEMEEDADSDLEEDTGATDMQDIDEENASYTVQVTDEEGNTTTIPATVFADLLGAYNIIRAFSWQLRLSPFSLQSLVVAMAKCTPNALVDELHVSLLRALASGECSKERKRHLLDLTMLDQTSWPEYVWEWLQLYGCHDLLGLRTRALQTEGKTLSQQTLEEIRAEIDSQLPKNRIKIKLNAASTSTGHTSEKQPGNSMEITGTAQSKPDADSMEVGVKVQQLKTEEQQSQQQTPAVAPKVSPGLAKLKAGWSSANSYRNRHLLHQEYYTLGLAANARILARLCDDLLESPHVRGEIDKREESGGIHTGKGGAGGAFPMRSAAERRRRQQQSEKPAKIKTEKGNNDEGSGSEEADDGNTDRCVLCGTGGSLLCCDACPAAYHLRCINENARSIPPGDWLCPECRVGGRGEAAGLRVPVSGLIPPANNEPAWVAYGCVFVQHCGKQHVPPGRLGRGRYKLPIDMASLGITMHSGQEAEQLVEEMTPYKPKSKDELPHPSSLTCLMPGEDPNDSDYEEPEQITMDIDKPQGDNKEDGTAPEGTAIVPAGPDVKGLAAGPHSGLTPLGQAVEKPDAYVNRYRSSWVHAVAAHQQHVEQEQRKLRRVAGGAAQLAVLPLPLPLSKFQWPQSQGKGKSTGVRKCGKCATCLRPTLKKACMNPIRKDGSQGEIQHAGRLAALQNWLLKAERELWGVLDGPWSDDGPGGTSWRRTWIDNVRYAGQIAPVDDISAVKAGADDEPAAAESKQVTDAAPSIKEAVGTDMETDKKQEKETVGDGIQQQDASLADASATVAKTDVTSNGEPQPTAMPAAKATDTVDSQEAGRLAIRQLVACLLQVEAGVRRQLHVYRNAWEPCSQPGKAVPKLWGLSCHSTATHMNEVETINQQPAPSIEVDPSNVPVSARGRVRSRAPRRVIIPDDDTEVQIAVFTKKRTGGWPRKKISTDGGGDGLETGDGDGAEPDGQEDATVAEKAAEETVAKPASEGKKRRGGARPGAGRKGRGGKAKRARLETSADGEASDEERPESDGDQEGIEGSQRPSEAGENKSLDDSKPQTPIDAPSRTPTPAILDSKTETESHVASPMAGIVQNVSVKPEGATTASGQMVLEPHSTALTPALTPFQTPATGADAMATPQIGRPAETNGRAAASNLVGSQDANQTDPTVQDIADSEQPIDEDDQEYDAGKEMQDDDDEDEEVRASRRLRKRRRTRTDDIPPEPRIRPTRAAALAATHKTKGHLSGRLNASVVHSATTTPATANAKSDRKGRRMPGSGRGRWPHTGADPTNPKAFFPSAGSEDEAGSSGSEAGDAWADMLDDMEDEAIRHASKAAFISGWKWLRTPDQRATGRGYLPASIARKLARVGGSRLIPGLVRYRESGESDLIPRVAWIAATERVTTSGALALQIRQLDRAVRWHALRRPMDHPQANKQPTASFTGLSLAAKRPMTTGDYKGYNEYFVVPEGASTVEVYLAMNAVQEAAQKSSEAGETVPPTEDAFIERQGEGEPFLCHWLPEYAVPLWMVRTFEERARADAMRSAAQSQTVAKEDLLVDLSSLEEATCAQCGVEYGEEPDSDSLWFQCEACRRWYHGACIGMNQGSADTPANTVWQCKACAAGYRTRRQAAAERHTKGRSRGGAAAHAGDASAPTAILRLGPDGQPVQKEQIEQELREIQAEQAARAAAAAAKAAEAAARRQEAQQARQRERELAMMQRARAAAVARAARKRKHAHSDDDEVSDENEMEEEEEGQIYCICRRPYTKDQAASMVACDGCDNWFHFKCVGTSQAEVEKSDKWFCPTCTAIRSGGGMITKGQYQRSSGPSASGRASGKRGGRVSMTPEGDETVVKTAIRHGPLRTPTSSITPQQASTAKAAGFDWSRAARGVISVLLTLDCAEDFAQPVPEEIPDYYDTIDNPMDLGTIRKKIDSNDYACPNEMLADVDLVWSNCHTFNRANSYIVKQANQAAAKFKQFWEQADIDTKILNAAGISKSVAVDLAADLQAAFQSSGIASAVLANLTGMQAGLPKSTPLPAMALPTTNQQAATQGAGMPLDIPGTLLPNLQTSGQASDAQQQQLGGDSQTVFGNPALDNWAPRAKIVLKALMREPCAAPFLHPVQASKLPDYASIVSQPMDLTTISDRLSITLSSNSPATAISRGGYSPTAYGLSRLLEDVALVWSNSKAYFGDNSEIGLTASSAERAFARLALQHGLPTQVPANAVASPTNKTERTSAASHASGSGRASIGLTPTGAPDWARRAIDVVRTVLQDPDCGWPFARPVKVADAPGYLDVIKRPMDLGTINDKLKRRKYSSEAEFLDDVQQVWTNCFTYNEEGDDYYNMGLAAQALFNRLYGTGQPHATDSRQQSRMPVSLQQSTQVLSQPTSIQPSRAPMRSAENQYTGLPRGLGNNNGINGNRTQQTQTSGLLQPQRATPGTAPQSQQQANPALLRYQQMLQQNKVKVMTPAQANNIQQQPPANQSQLHVPTAGIQNITTHNIGSAAMNQGLSPMQGLQQPGQQPFQGGLLQGQGVGSMPDNALHTGQLTSQTLPYQATHQQQMYQGPPPPNTAGNVDVGLQQFTSTSLPPVGFGQGSQAMLGNMPMGQQAVPPPGMQQQGPQQ